MYDSDNPDAIPDGVPAAGYCDGYAAAAWNARGWARFPTALRIAVFASTNDGHVLDVERFDATPDQAPGWVLRRRSAGVPRPWVYCNRSNRPTVEAALRAGGLRADQVALWVATLDGTQTVPPGFYPVAAVQFANSAHSGGHYDLSLFNATYGPGTGLLQETKVNIGEKRGWVDVLYLVGFGRTPESVAVRDGWANLIADDGSNLDDGTPSSIVARIVNSAEGTAYRAKLAAVLAAGPAPAGAPGPQGPPGPAGEQGPPGPAPKTATFGY